MPNFLSRPFFSVIIIDLIFITVIRRQIKEQNLNCYHTVPYWSIKTRVIQCDANLVFSPLLLFKVLYIYAVGILIDWIKKDTRKLIQRHTQIYLIYSMIWELQ